MLEVKQDNYMINLKDVETNLAEIKSIGRRLDNDSNYNIVSLEILATGERFGRLLAEIGYPDGTVVLFYRSMTGKSGKDQGMWYPIGGFFNKTDKDFTNLLDGWFVKDHDMLDRYGSKTFQGTANYLFKEEG